ncbi:MAG: lipid-A-disaccharide synthase [Deferribacteres bacterium]|nr:lipid-A-disaccharide synthase [Deferribacteres bacterium]
MKKVLVVAAEDSASFHASRLLEKLRGLGDFSFFGVGTRSLLDEHMDVVYDSSELSFVGLEEPAKLFKIVKIYSSLKGFAKEADGLLLIDYPGMNLRLARYAKRCGKPVCYYVAPQVWAWWRSRVKAVRASVDRLVCLFPFEVDFFRNYGVSARFFGHPLVNLLEGYKGESRDCIVFLPGSRESEFSRLFPVMLEASVKLKRLFPERRFAFIRAPGIPRERFGSLFPWIELVEPDERFEVMGKALCAVSASGTATLELAVLEVPTVVVYRTSRLTFELGRRLVKVNNLSIVNILAQREVFPELLQERLQAERVVDWMRLFVVDYNLRRNILKAVRKVVEDLKGDNPYMKAAEFFCEVLC